MQCPRTHEQVVGKFGERVYQVIGVAVGEKAFADGVTSRS